MIERRWKGEVNLHLRIPGIRLFGFCCCHCRGEESSARFSDCYSISDSPVKSRTDGRLSRIGVRKKSFLAQSSPHFLLQSATTFVASWVLWLPSLSLRLLRPDFLHWGKSLPYSQNELRLTGRQAGEMDSFSTPFFLYLRTLLLSFIWLVCFLCPIFQKSLFGIQNGRVTVQSISWLTSAEGKGSTLQIYF